MTIELITGTPGAGKTTFAVAERLAVEVKRKLKTEEGVEYSRRVLVAGVRGLVLEHERLPHKLTGEKITDQDVDRWNAMASGDTPVYQRLAGDPVLTESPELVARDGVLVETGKTVTVTPMVQNWWLWCKPGDLILVDEAQFLAPRGILGRKPPYWIQALEIHRHYGVDFIFITQHPQLIDTTIRNLVGLHRHVRSVMGSAVCMTYVWDHASNPERASLASKKAWVRRSSHYKLFHSSVAHIKPPNAGRGALLASLLLVGGFGWGITEFLGKFQPEETAQTAESPAIANAQPDYQAATPVESPSSEPQQAPLSIVGCIDAGTAGGYCVDSQGGRVDVPPDVLAFNARNLGGFVKLDLTHSTQAAPVPDAPASTPKPAQQPSPPALASAEIDGSILATMR
jgi:zona occludens toxin (predicted ATPase)